MPFCLLPSAESEVYAYAPGDVEALGKLPIIVFLHGAGERGPNPEDVLRSDLRSLIEELRLPAVWLFPRCSQDYAAFYGSMEDRVLSAIGSALAKFSTDPARIYLMGYSMGATSCLWLAARHPQKFAGVVSISVGITWEEEQLPPNIPDHVRDLFVAMYHVGANRPAFIAKRILSTPIWFIHGSDDDACPLTDSTSVVAEMHKLGTQSMLTVYANEGHGILMKALKEPGLFDWLLQQRCAAAKTIG